MTISGDRPYPNKPGFVKVTGLLIRTAISGRAIMYLEELTTLQPTVYLPPTVQEMGQAGDNRPVSYSGHAHTRH